MSLKACGGITAPMLPVKQETEVVKVRCSTCLDFVEQLKAIAKKESNPSQDCHLDYFLPHH
ncbi:MAG: hypothetical protein HC815_30870 [Richelia sp. RM1_1_1]|nr:hypothetical protein [Richelia sp. RM1_1_1]